MKVRRNTFYNWLKLAHQYKKNTNTLILMERIRGVFHESKEVYGSLRIQKQLEREDIFFLVLTLVF